MIVLDTNVISEMMRDTPEAAVRAWLDEQMATRLFVTTVTEAEIRFGIARLPDGKRRDGLAAAAAQAFATFFHDRVVAFDSDAAKAYAAIAAYREVGGRPISQFDCQIAAIAASRGAAIATRNVTDFEACGIEIINPWTANN